MERRLNRESPNGSKRRGLPTDPEVRSHKGLILLALCSAALIINIDVTIVNVTLPSLVRELGATTTNLQWVVDAYSLVFAALILAAGSLSDRLGRKGLLLIGLAVFALGSLVGSLVKTPHELIAARAVMGVGAAAIFPSTLSLLTNVFTDRKERAQAIGLWGATTGVGVAIGPIVGGWLLGHFWWGSVFLFMVPVAVVVAVLIASFVPSSKDPATPPLDWRGLILSSAAMGTLILSIIQAPNWGWGSVRTLGTIAVGLVILAVFINVERRMARPMLDVGLFRNLRFTAASGSITIGFFTLAGFTFLITQYFQFVKGYTAFGTGVRLLPVATSIALASVIGPRLAARIGTMPVVAGGLAVFAAGLAWASSVSEVTSYGEIAVQMVLLGGGLGFTTAPATESIMGSLSVDKAGVGSAVNDTTRELGGTLGVAIVGSVFASVYDRHLSHQVAISSLPAAPRAAAGRSLAAAYQVAGALPARSAHSVIAAANRAFLDGLQAGALVCAAIAVLAAVAVVALLPSRAAVDARDDVPVDETMAVRVA